MLQAEIRSTLASLPQTACVAAIMRAIDEGDDMVAEAALSAPKILTGMSPAELAHVRASWAQK